MSSDLKRFMHLALLRVRHLQQEARGQIQALGEPNPDVASEVTKLKSEIEYLRVVEELIREQNPNENSDHTAR